MVHKTSASVVHKTSASVVHKTSASVVHKTRASVVHKTRASVVNNKVIIAVSFVQSQHDYEPYTPSEVGGAINADN